MPRSLFTAHHLIVGSFLTLVLALGSGGALAADYPLPTGGGGGGGTTTGGGGGTGGTVQPPVDPQPALGDGSVTLNGGTTSPASGGGLPFTGADVRDLSLFGLGIAGTGVVLVRRGSRRRLDHTPA